MSFRSRALAGRLHLAVVLPRGYGLARHRYPVVYFLHGLPASARGYRGFQLVAGALSRAGRRAILVAPQGARERESDPEYLDRGPGDRWETALADELPRFVDAHFQTLPDRRARALVGLSAGGYGATLLTLHHLSVFSVVESWSGYFHPTDVTGKRPLDLGSRAANRRASVHSLVGKLRRAFASRPTFFGFYVGLADTRFRNENLRLDAELRAAHVPHSFRIYPGGHQPVLWSAHATQWLRTALAHLEPPRP